MDTPLSPNTIIIDESNWKRHATTPRINGIKMGRGYKGMWKEGCQAPKEFGDLGIPLIPEDEWIDRIEEQDRLKSNLYHFSIGSGLTCKNQRSTNYCWVNAPIHCAEIERLKETGVVTSYSPASAGAPIKNFNNVGGWGSEALERMREEGFNESVDWPDNEINRRYYTDENRAKAKLNHVIEYFILRNWQEVVSCNLALIPVAVGLNWWRHEVTYTHLVVIQRQVEQGFRNSWGESYGDKGFGVLKGRQKFPDDAVAVVTMQPK